MHHKLILATPYIILITLAQACTNKSIPPSSSAEPQSPSKLHPKAQQKTDSPLFNSIILSITEDNKGNYWLGSWCDGLCKYNPSATSAEERFTYYTTDNGLPYPEMTQYNNRKVPRGHSPRNIQVDQNGHILFATVGGVVKYDGQTFSELKIEKPAQLITDHSSAQISAGNWDELNQIWFGNINGNGVYRYDGQELIHLTFAEEHSVTSRFSKYATYSIGKDNKGNLWFGTEAGGIFKYSKDSLICINKDAEKGIVRAIFQDDSGKVWMSNVLQGLHYYDHEAYLAGKDYFINFTDQKGYYNLSETRAYDHLDKNKTLDSVQSITQDDDGILWFGTFTRGLWRYDPKADTASGENELIHYTEENGLPSNTVKTIYKDKNGRLLFGIGEEEASVYYFEDEEFIRLR